MTIALLLFFVTFLMGVFDLFAGRNMFNRPILTGTVVGFILGDVTQGVIIGATLELAFIGLFAVGAAMPPEILTGGILGTAFAISSGTGTETALLLAFPIASVALIFRNLHLILISPMFLHKADKYAIKGSFKGVASMHILAGLIQILILALIVGVSFSVGSSTVTNILDKIPGFVQTGLEVATKILPALGFALLGRMLINKRVVPYFFIGFALVSYLSLSVVGIAVIGAMIAIIMVDLDNRNKQVPIQPGGQGGIDDDDDF